MKNIRFVLVSCVILSLSACNYNYTFEPEEKKRLIDCIYQSLNLTPEEFTAQMVQQNLYERADHELGDVRYRLFSNVPPNSNSGNGKFGITIYYSNNTINSVEYGRNLNNESNPAACYKLFSDMIASYGYSDWHGYCRNDLTPQAMDSIILFGDNIATNDITNQVDLCNRIDNNKLFELNTQQYIVERFTYIDKKNNRWNGKLFLFTTEFYEKQWITYSDDPVRDIHFNFSLERISDK